MTTNVYTELRKLLRKRIKEVTLKTVSEESGIPRPILSRFANKVRPGMGPENTARLADYLDYDVRLVRHAH